MVHDEHTLEELRERITPRWGNWLSADTVAGLHVAAPAGLEEPLTDAHLTQLDASERQDIAYHRPERVGDALYNWFD